MSLVPLNPSPTPIYPGGVQTSVLLVNNGLRPMTVSSSSAPLSGDVLYPGASMLWPDKTPLYAMGFAGDYLQVGQGVSDYTNANAVATQLANTTLTTTGGGGGTTPTTPTTIGTFTEIANLSTWGPTVNGINVETDGTNWFLGGGFDTTNSNILTRFLNMTPTGTAIASTPSLPWISYGNASWFAGTVFVIGTGFQDGAVTTSAIYLANGSSGWTAASAFASTARRRFFPGSCKLDGVYYMVCGSTTSQVGQATGQLLSTTDINSITTSLADAGTNRYNPTLVPFGTKKLWLIGGLNESGVNLSSTRIYDVTANTWSDGPSLPEPVGLGSACVVGSYLFVYCAPTGAFYRGDGTTWTKLSVTLPWNAGDGMRMRALGSNIYVFGGINTNKIGKALVS